MCYGVCVFITAVHITKLFAWGEGIVEDMCYVFVFVSVRTNKRHHHHYYRGTYYKAVREGRARQ
jgi:hypothetical protein